MAIDAGMNIAEVEALALTLRKSADELAGFAAVLNRLVTTAAWQGPTAAKFKQQWWPQHRTRVGQIEANIRGFGQSAVNNASDQRKASEEGVGAAIAGGGSSLPTDTPTLRDIIKLPMDEQVAAWNALTKQQQNALLKGREASLGDLAFVAPEIRYAANRELIFEEYMKLNAQGTLDPSSKLRLDLYERILREKQQVLFFDPSGDGRIAVVQGDLAHATHVAVTVPGISSNLDNFGKLIDEGGRLRGSAGSDTAVVSWLGYDAPVGVGLNLARDVGEITNTVLAKPGASALVGFVAELRGTNPAADLTVIGHSYGSLVTGLAAQQGLDANKIVFIGSPGVGVGSVNDFHLPAGARVFAAEPGPGAQYDGVGVGGDPVSNLGHNLHPFGGVPTEHGFGAEVVNIGNRFDIADSHSEYFQANSVSLEKLGAIVRVEGDTGI